MTTPYSGARDIINTAIESAEPAELEPNHIYAWLTSQGNVVVKDLTGDEYRATPARKAGHVTVDDLESFTAYWSKHSDAGSEIYVDVERHTVTAVLDASTDQAGDEGARWGGHRLTWQMRTSQRWNEWLGNDRRPLAQTDWAEFVEDHHLDIRTPDAATMLEIAQTFQSTTKAKFGSTHILSNGSRTLNWEETTGATAGEGGKLTVPSRFSIGIPPFEFSPVPYQIDARFRYRVASGQLLVTYLLDDPAERLRQAVKEQVGLLEAALNQGLDTESGSAVPVKVLYGQPAPAR